MAAKPSPPGREDDDIDVAAVDEVASFLASLPPAERRQLPGSSLYVAQILHAWRACAAAGPDGDPRRFTTIRPFARWWLNDTTARALWSAPDPLTSEYVNMVATRLASLAYGELARKYGREYVEADGAPGAAALTLAKLGKAQTRRPRVINDFWAHYRSAVRREIAREMRLLQRALYPGEYARWVLFCRRVTQLRRDCPELSDGERREHAAAWADRMLKKTAGFIWRVEDELRFSDVSDVSDLAGTAEGRALVDQIGELVKLPFFTDIDRDAWRRFVAADLVGADVAWRTAGVDPGVGAQRLHTLFRKLGRLLRDWRRPPDD